MCDLIWQQVVREIGEGNAVMAWSAAKEAGFDFATGGKNRRVPVDFQGLRLVAFCEEPALPAAALPPLPPPRRG